MHYNNSDSNVVAIPTLNKFSLHLPYNLLAVNAARRLRGRFDKGRKFWIYDPKYEEEFYFLDRIFNSEPILITCQINTHHQYVKRKAFFNIGLSFLGIPIVRIFEGVPMPNFDVDFSSDARIELFEGEIAGLSNGSEFTLYVPEKLLDLFCDPEKELKHRSLLDRRKVHQEINFDEVQIYIA